jgi:prophage regulatory protein
MNIPANFNDPTGNTLVRLPGVIAMTGMGRATVYDFMDRGLFPMPIKIGPKLAAWPADEVSKINAARIAGRNNDEVKALVSDLMAERKNRT